MNYREQISKKNLEEASTLLKIVIRHLEKAFSNENLERKEECYKSLIKANNLSKCLKDIYDNT